MNFSGGLEGKLSKTEELQQKLLTFLLMFVARCFDFEHAKRLLNEFSALDAEILL
jgi:hypothetical protein